MLVFGGGFGPVNWRLFHGAPERAANGLDELDSMIFLLNDRGRPPCQRWRSPEWLSQLREQTSVQRSVQVKTCKTDHRRCGCNSIKWTSIFGIEQRDAQMNQQITHRAKRAGLLFLF